MIKDYLHRYILVTITVFSFCFVANSISYSEETPQGNRNYFVFVENKNTIKAYDLKKQQLLSKKFDFNIQDLEVCQSFPFASFTIYDKKDSSSSKKFIIYDLEFNRIYNQNLYLDANERRWSASGDYTYINNLTSFYLLKTRFLRDYLESKLDTSQMIEIEGHPLGYIFQEMWIGNYIFYGSGSGDMECWGALNVETQENYFISCCGPLTSKITIGSCTKVNREPNKILKLMLSKMKGDGIHKISNDFFNEVMKLNKKSQTK